MATERITRSNNICFVVNTLFTSLMIKRRKKLWSETRNQKLKVLEVVRKRQNIHFFFFNIANCTTLLTLTQIKYKRWNTTNKTKKKQKKYTTQVHMYWKNYSFGLKSNAIRNQYTICNNIPIEIYIELVTDDKMMVRQPYYYNAFLSLFSLINVSIIKKKKMVSVPVWKGIYK